MLLSLDRIHNAMGASFNAILVSTSGMSFQILWDCCNILFRVIDSGFFFMLSSGRNHFQN